jgi:hypothetical protein
MTDMGWLGTKQFGEQCEAKSGKINRYRELGVIPSELWRRNGRSIQYSPKAEDWVKLALEIGGFKAATDDRLGKIFRAIHDKLGIESSSVETVRSIWNRDYEAFLKELVKLGVELDAEVLENA